LRRYLVALFILILIILACSQVQTRDFDIPLSLRFDPEYYLNSSGGKTKNGCEAWATSLKTKEYIYVGKCDIERLARLSFHIKEALKFNNSLPVNQQIVKSGSYTMIDYSNSKHQALFGYTASGLLAHIILNEKKDFLYYKIDGNIPELKETGIQIESLLNQNKSLPQDEMIKAEKANLSFARDMKHNYQYLIGNNSKGKRTAVMFDNNGKILGYKNLIQ
jgi:uncharacterized lipoprotein NlpE involved in copper resistance